MYDKDITVHPGGQGYVSETLPIGIATFLEFEDGLGGS